MSIVYTQIRTSADLLQSTIRIEELIPFLQQQKAEACAIVNTKLYGLLPFWHGLKKTGIHPVVGLKVRVLFDEEISLPLVLYAKTNEGYKNILKISSAIAIRKDEQLPWRWLVGYSKGCICSLPAMDDDSIWFNQNYEQQARQVAQLFQSNFVIGVSRPGGIKSSFEENAMHLSRHLQAPIMAMHESLFVNRNDYFAYEVLRSIDTGVKLSEKVESKQMFQQYLPTKEELLNWYSDQLQWLEVSRQLLLNCRVDISFNQHFMPKFPLKEGETADEVLTRAAISGLKERLQTETPNRNYIERLKYEIQIITSMGYADYFLIVADFMRFARKENILTGPGRGSSASSLVAYCLQITQVDPLKYGLLFERFLNPERITLPDIDIDFVDTKRQKVIQYVAEKYGQQYVAQIITFGTLSAKAVARDVARMFNFEQETLEMISRLIPNRLGITLQEAYNSSEDFRKWVEGEEIRRRWFETALKLEGLPKNSSTHAAGVVLSPMPLVDVVPIQEGHDGIYLTQWPMQEIEQSGLLKMDFLGLRNLTILEQIRKSIYYSHRVKIDLNQIPLNDEKTYLLLQQGDTTGIFQLESEGMKKALKEIIPTDFLDIVAVNALYRPGPMEFISVYARRKHGQEPVVMPHPVLEPILKETYGVIVYQEQIMKIANLFAGFTIGQADLLRRAVSKKKREVLEEQRTSFVKGAILQGYPEKSAEEVYKLIVRFADYGFPKSHAVAYSMISYQMAYLKANYPVNFYSALMTNAIGNQDKLSQIISEAKGKGIELLRPSIHKSIRPFKVENGKIRFSLSTIKGVSQVFIQRLMAVRDTRQHPFEDLFELAVSLSAIHFNRKFIEPLIKSGALDDFGKDRATLLASIDAAEKHAKIVRPNDEEDLFSSNHFIFGKPKYIDAEPIPQKIKLQFEKEVLGFYLSEHPVETVRKKFGNVNSNIQTIQQLRPNSIIKLVGMIEGIRQIRTKKGELMAFVELQDEYGIVSATLFPKEYNEVLGWIKEEKIVYVEGSVDFRFGKSQIKVKSMKLI